MSNIKDDVESLLQFTLNVEQKMEDMKTKLKHFEELRITLIQQTNYYREENDKMENILKKLEVLRNHLSVQCQGEFDKLKSAQEEYGVKRCTSEAIGLSHAERLRKQTNYLSKIKSCIKMHNYLIEKLSKEIQIAKSEFHKSRTKIENISTISSDEIKTLKAKIERYEKELSKFEKKYPWLKDPQYNLQNILKKTELLKVLQQEREKLLEELDVYQGLKPDVNEARQQLTAMKQEYMSIH